LTPTDTLVVSVFTGLLVGLLVNVIVAFFQRPSLEIRPDDDRPDTKFPDRYIHVRVINRKHPLFNRNMALNCESKVWIADTRTGEIRGPFKTKWARLSTIVYDSSTQRLEWKSVPSQETRLDIYPGHSDGGAEGVQLDVVLKTKDICLVHDPELYYHLKELERWKLVEGQYYVMIRIQYSQKQSDPRYFLLANKELYETSLTACSYEDLEKARTVFKSIGPDGAKWSIPSNLTSWKADSKPQVSSSRF